MAILAGINMGSQVLGGLSAGRDAQKYQKEQQQAIAMANLANAFGGGRYNMQPAIGGFNPSKTTSVLSGLGQASGMGMNAMSLANMLKSQGLQNTLMQQQVDQGAMANEMSKLGSQGMSPVGMLGGAGKSVAGAGGAPGADMPNILRGLGKSGASAAQMADVEVPGQWMERAGSTSWGAPLERASSGPKVSVGEVFSDQGLAGLPEWGTAISEGMTERNKAEVDRIKAAGAALGRAQPRLDPEALSQSYAGGDFSSPESIGFPFFEDEYRKAAAQAATDRSAASGKSLDMARYRKSVIDTAIDTAKEVNAQTAMAYLEQNMAGTGISAGDIQSVLDQASDTVDLDATAKTTVAKSLAIYSALDDALKMLKDPARQQELGGLAGRVKAWTATGGSIRDYVLSLDEPQLSTQLSLLGANTAYLKTGAAMNTEEVNLFFERLLGGLESGPEGLRVRMQELQKDMKRTVDNLLRAEDISRGRQDLPWATPAPQSQSRQTRTGQLLRQQ